MAEQGESSAITEPVLYNVKEWLHENEKFFQPPVCNKLMHRDGQLKVFFVGGPNQRKDYHIEEGEEFFYMIKGDMCLKIVERGIHKDVHIKEGQVFLLPGYMLHSPQRNADTIGLVIERERAAHEKDGLRYFVETDGQPTLEILYEKWFHCSDLGPQLARIVKEFFQMEQYRTGKPVPGTITSPPITVDTTTEVVEPFHLKDWLRNNKEMIDKNGHVPLFGDGHQFQIDIYGECTREDQLQDCEVLIWQLEGSSHVTVCHSNRVYTLHEGDTILVPINKAL